MTNIHIENSYPSLSNIEIKEQDKTFQPPKNMSRAHNLSKDIIPEVSEENMSQSQSSNQIIRKLQKKQVTIDDK